MEFDALKPAVMLASVVYALIGVAVLWLAFVLIDKLTPYQLWDEIVEKKNLALAVVVGAMFIAIGLIVAAAIHG
jgi:putative membrane protein